MTTTVKHRRGRRARVAAAAALSLLCAAELAVAEPLKLTGFNLAGAEFGSLPGQAGTDYFYPADADVNELLLRGANVFRLPFRWERLQPKLDQPFDLLETERLIAAVKLITGKGARVIVSPYNFGRYENQPVGSAAVPTEAFASFWRDLAKLFRDNSLVLFGLMNEPHDMPTEKWRDAANAAIVEIRRAGGANLILVPGNAWTGGQSWLSPDYGTSNAAAFSDLKDPLDNFAFEIHQYLDADFSGTHSVCQNADVGQQALKGVTDWLARTGHKAFLAEFGSTTNPTCLQAMDTMLYYVEEHPEQWSGWTYWAGGSWWGANPLSAQPQAGVDPPQLTTLLAHLRQP